MRKFNFFFFSVLMGCVSLLAACGAPQATGDQARQVVEQFYAALKAADYTGAAGHMDPNFFQREPQDVWIASMKNVAAKLGPLQEMKLKESQINTIYSGRQFLYIFINRYEKGNATETVVLLQPLDKKEIKVVAYKVESVLL